MRRRFEGASALSQQSFANSIVDLVLSKGDSSVLVEIKIVARETETKTNGKGRMPQVQKYLDLKEGHVAYLTTKAVGQPGGNTNKWNYLGHFFFEDLYDQLVRAELTDVGRLFHQFMEENGMKALEPFTQKELDHAGQAFGFAKKCEAFLDEIKSEVEEEFLGLFQTPTGFTRGHFSPRYACAYTESGKLRRWKVNQVEIYIEPDNGRLVYGVCVRVLRTNINRLKKHLKWKEDGGYLYTSYSVKPDTKRRKCIDPIRRDLKELQRALKKYCR